MPNSRNSPYEFIYVGGQHFTYVFVTRQLVVYEIKFKPSSYIFGEQPPFTEFAFEFVIEVAENPLPHPSPPDPAISLTIVQIFNHFFRAKETVVVYICDNSDGRANARNRKFSAWFEQAQTGVFNFVKFDYRFGSDEEYFLTSLIMRIDNPRMAELITAFQSMVIDYDNPEK